MALYRVHHRAGCLHHTDATGQVLGFSVPPVWPNTIDGFQLALGAIMCLLIAVRFTKQALQMYKATKRLQLSRYMNVLSREGLIYFLAYVHIPPFLPLPLRCR